MKEFFGLTKLENGSYDYLREAEGAWSWQHLLFVSLLMVVMVALAVWLGVRNKEKPCVDCLRFFDQWVRGAEDCGALHSLPKPLAVAVRIALVPLQCTTDCDSDGGVL
jgi:hypothetical protein